jgi:UDP-glucose 4-epimerase
MLNKNITIYSDGLQTRTFCYIDDNIDTCVNAFYKDQIVNDVINVGGHIEITMIDLAKKIIKLAKSKSKIIFLPALEEGDMLRRFPDTTKMMKLLNREPISLDEGIKKIIDNPQFIIR